MSENFNEERRNGGIRSVKEDVAEVIDAGSATKNAEINGAIEMARVYDAYDVAGVQNPDYQQTNLEGFEGQPEKPIFRGRGSTWAANTPFVKDPEAVQAAMANATRWRTLGIRHRPRSNQEILDRIDYYFEQCIVDAIRPTVETMSLALGYSRISVWNWKNGIKCDSQRQAIIQAAYDTIAAFDADMVTNGAMNPVVYIFRSKNFYDMRDQTELVVKPDNPLGEIVAVEDIERKYEELPDE